MSYVPDQASWTHLPTHTPIQLNHTNFTHPPNSCDSGPQNFGDYNAPIQSFAPTSKPEASIPWPTMHQTAAWTPQSDSCKLSPDSQGRHSATSSATSDTGSPPISQRPSVGPEEFAAMSNQTLRAVKEESEVTGEMVEKVSPSVPTEVKSDVVVPMPTIATEQEEASSLLLSLSQPSALQTSPVLTDSALNTPFTKAQLASLRIEERIRNEALAPPASEPTLSASAAESIDTIVNTVATADFEVSYAPPISSVPDHSGSPPRTGRGFLRAPGLGPIEEGKSDETVYTCPVCSFCCRSKFHYNSHMNTHGDHRCSMCDYTSRTEGRLKKHMRESHTRDEQIAAGMDVPPEAPTLDFTTAMASVMEIAKSAVAAVTDGTPGEGTQPAFPSALDSIRQLTEGNPAQMALNMFAQVGGDDENDVTLGGKIDAPARRAGGKPKKYKCKNCEHISASKEESWRHNREHIPVEKQLSCQYCDFVTEYKHHLEYHCRNHMGSKPFKCTKCSYCCVNKSMLNSHMKSHSEHYMFQCIDCNYQSKYCHSLKMHLHKYNHRRKPGMTVDDAADAIENDPNIEDPGSIPTNYSDSPGANGTPAPMPTQTPHLVEMGAMPVATLPTSTPATPVSGIANILLSPLSGSSATVQSYADIIRAQRQEQFNEIMLRAQAAQTYNCSMCDYSTTASDQMVQHNVIHLQANAAAAAVAAPPAQPSQPLSALFQYLTNLQQQQQQQQQQISAPQVMSQLPQQFSAHDMIMRAAQQQQQQQMVMPPAPVVQMPPPTQRVPSPLIKMEVDVHSPTSPSPDDTSGDRSSSSPGDHSEVNSVRSNGSRKRKAKSSVRLEEISARLQGKSSPEDAGLPLSQPTQFDPKQPTYSNHCHTCNMGFGDMALYTIHRGYHGFDNPLKCNRCGKVYTNSLDFNLHLMQAQHD